MLRFVVLHYVEIVLVAVAAYAGARRFLRRVSFAGLAEEVAICIGLGLGLLGSAIFIAGLIGLLYPPVVVLLLVAFFVAGVKEVGGLCQRGSQAIRSSLSGRLARGVPLLAAASLAIGGLALFGMNALYPPSLWDALSYHLPPAKIFATEHVIRSTPFLRVCTFPQLSEMWFAGALSVADDITAQLFEFLAALVSGLAVYAWGRRSFSARTGWWAASAWLGSPLVILLAGSAYIDVGLTMFVTLAIYATSKCYSSGELHWGGLAGAFVGFAAASKYSGLFFGAILATLLVLFSWRHKAWRPLAAFVVCGAIAAGPWYLRNYVVAGNPLFPLLSTVFGTGCWDADDVSRWMAELRRPGIGRSWTSLAKLPWYLATNQRLFEAETPANPVIFAGLVLGAALAVRWREARLVLFVAAASMPYWFFTSQVLRYLLPIFPLLALLLSASLDRVVHWIDPRATPARNWVWTVAISIALCLPSLRFATVHIRVSGPPRSSARERSLYLQNFEPYLCYDYLNSHYGSNFRLYGLYDEYMAYFADGTRMGDVFGPARYSDLHFESGASLFNSLRRLRADFFLVTWGGLQVRLPEDPFFRQHFEVVAAGSYTRLYRLVDRPIESSAGPNLLEDPGFEERRATSSKAWAFSGDARVEESRTRSHQGFGVLRIAGGGQSASCPTKVRPWQLYAIALFARSGNGNASCSVFLEWLNAENQRVGWNRQSFQVPDQWTACEMEASAPSSATSVRIFVTPVPGSELWFDDFFLAALTSAAIGSG